ncbi:hypothetical protein Drorol1_Dr00025901 [Drosera rotundifolia]
MNLQSCSLLTWRTKPYPLPTLTPSLPKPTVILSLSRSLTPLAAAAAADSSSPLSPKELRRLKNEKRETNPGRNWREEVEEMLLATPKKKNGRKKITWDDVNLDALARLGPRWWTVRVARGGMKELPERLGKALSVRFPAMDFKVYVPAVELKKKSKDGIYDVKSKPIYPGKVFLRCVLSREIHNFIREQYKVVGFTATRIGDSRRQVYKPKPMDEGEMEKVFKRAKEEQEKADKAFEDELKGLPEPQKSSPNTPPSINGVIEAVKEPKLKARSKRTSNKSGTKLRLGTKVKVVSGTFADFSGIIKKLDAKNEKVTIGFTLFGKETNADLSIHEIVAVTK